MIATAINGTVANYQLAVATAIIRTVGGCCNVSESRSLIKEISKQNKLLKEITFEKAHIVRALLARLMGLCSFQSLKFTMNGRRMIWWI